MRNQAGHLNISEQTSLYDEERHRLSVGESPNAKPLGLPNAPSPLVANLNHTLYLPPPSADLVRRSCRRDSIDLVPPALFHLPLLKLILKSYPFLFG
jgi:hypothetical protein